MLTFFSSSAARRGSETDLGTSEDLFLGLKIDLCRCDDFFLLLRFFPTEKPLQFSYICTKTVPMSDANSRNNLMLKKSAI